MARSSGKAQARAKRPWQLSLLAPAVALNAAGAMTVEIVAGRLLAPYFGMSLYTWTTVIGVVLAGLTIGHWAGGLLAEHYPRRMTWLISLAFWAGAVTTLLVLPITALVAGGLVLQRTPPALAVTLSGFAAFFLPSLVAGLVQPLATTFALQSEGRTSGRIVGRMLAAGAFGSILGTFLAGFVLISYLGSAGTVWLVTGVNAVLGALFLTVMPVPAAAVAAAAGLSAAGLSVAPLPGFAVPCQTESRYYCIRVDRADHLTGRASTLMALDHLVHSVNDTADPQHLFSPYVHLVDEIARHKFSGRAFTAFFVGGGGYTLPRAWLARDRARRIAVAEIDPEVTRLARERMGFAPGPNTRIETQDARVALASAGDGARYDVIFGDAFHDIAIPSHLVTDEFHALVRARLAPDGFYALNVVDDPRRPRLLASILRTLRKQFGALEVWVSPQDVRGARRATFIVYASAEATGLPGSFRAKEGRDRVWLRVSLDSIGIDTLGVFLTDDFAPVDRLLSALWLYGD